MPGSEANDAFHRVTPCIIMASLQLPIRIRVALSSRHEHLG